MSMPPRKTQPLQTATSEQRQKRATTTTGHGKRSRERGFVSRQNTRRVIVSASSSSAHDQRQYEDHDITPADRAQTVCIIAKYLAQASQKEDQSSSERAAVIEKHFFWACYWTRGLQGGDVVFSHTAYIRSLPRLLQSIGEKCGRLLTTWQDLYAVSPACEQVRCNKRVVEDVICGENKPEGMYSCKRCGSKSTEYSLFQTRRADEGSTAFLFCKNCGARYRLQS